MKPGDSPTLSSSKLDKLNGNLPRQDSRYAASEAGTAFSLPDLGSSAGSVADFNVNGGGTRAIGELRPLLRASRPMPFGKTGEYVVFLSRTLLYQRFGLSLEADESGMIHVAEGMPHLEMQKGDQLISINGTRVKSVEGCRQVLDVALRLELRLRSVSFTGSSWFCVGGGEPPPNAPPAELMKDLLAASLPLPRGLKGEFTLSIRRQSVYQKYGISFGTDVDLGIPRDSDQHWPIVIAEDAPHLGLQKGDRLKYINNTPAMIGGRCQSILDRSVHVELVLQRRHGDVSTQRQYSELLHAHLRHSTYEEERRADVEAENQPKERKSWFAFLFACQSTKDKNVGSKRSPETILANSDTNLDVIDESCESTPRLQVVDDSESKLQADSDNAAFPSLKPAESPMTPEAPVSDISVSTLDTSVKSDAPLLKLKDAKSNGAKPTTSFSSESGKTKRNGDLDFVLSKIDSIEQSLKKTSSEINASNQGTKQSRDLKLNLGAGVGSFEDENGVKDEEESTAPSSSSTAKPWFVPTPRTQAAIASTGEYEAVPHGALPLIMPTPRTPAVPHESWSKGLDAWLSQPHRVRGQKQLMTTVQEDSEMPMTARPGYRDAMGVEDHLAKVQLRAKVRAFARSLTRGISIKVPDKEHTSVTEFHEASMRLGKSSDGLEKLVVEMTDKSSQGFLLVHVDEVLRYEEALQTYRNLSQEWPVEEDVQDCAAVIHYDSHSGQVKLFCIVEQANRWREQLVDCLDMLSQYARERHRGAGTPRS